MGETGYRVTLGIPPSMLFKKNTNQPTSLRGTSEPFLSFVQPPPNPSPAITVTPLCKLSPRFTQGPNQYNRCSGSLPISNIFSTFLPFTQVALATTLASMSQSLCSSSSFCFESPSYYLDLFFHLFLLFQCHHLNMTDDPDHPFKTAGRSPTSCLIFLITF